MFPALPSVCSLHSSKFSTAPCPHYLRCCLLRRVLSRFSERRSAVSSRTATSIPRAPLSNSSSVASSLPSPRTQRLVLSNSKLAIPATADTSTIFPTHFLLIACCNSVLCQRTRLLAHHCASQRTPAPARARRRRPEQARAGHRRPERARVGQSRPGNA